MCILGMFSFSGILTRVLVMSPVFFVSASSAFMAAFLGLSVVAVPTVRDTNNEIEFDFVGRGPGPQEQQRGKGQGGAQRYQTKNEDEQSVCRCRRCERPDAEPTSPTTRPVEPLEGAIRTAQMPEAKR